MIETYAPDNSFNRAMYNFIYAFHMPFFMFISGRFSQINNRSKYIHSILAIFETFIVFQFIRYLKPVIAGESFEINFYLLYPKGTLWYLAYLILYRLFILFMPRNCLENHPTTLLFSSFSLGILWGFMPTNNHQKLLSFFPYFMLGYYSVKTNIKDVIKAIPLFLSIIGIIAIFIITYFSINYNIGYIIYYELSYYCTDPVVAPEFLCLYRFLAYFSAIIISIFIMRIVVDNNILSKYGSKTLFIYMYHTFIILALRSVISRGYLWEDAIFLIAYTISIIVLLLLLSNISFFTILMNPITYITKKKDKSKGYINHI